MRILLKISLYRCQLTVCCAECASQSLAVATTCLCMCMAGRDTMRTSWSRTAAAPDTRGPSASGGRVVVIR